MSESRISLKIAATLHAEISSLSDDYGFSIADMTDLLLEYTTATADRVDEAINERRAKGSARARKRRGE